MTGVVCGFGALVQHQSEQTGLTFKAEKRKVPVLTATRKEK